MVDDKGKPVAFKDGTPRGIYKPLDVTRAPGKEVDLYELNLTVGEKNIDPRKASTLYGEGKFQLQYKQIIGESMLSSVAIQCDPLFRKLETGKLDLVVSRWIRRWAQEKQKEPITAWGNEVNGLQAGLGFRTGENRVYNHGEPVTLVIRLRNVSKDVVKFSYLQPFVEHSLTVTGSDGKAVSQPTVIPDIGERNAGVVELPPGKEIELHEMKRQLRPAGESKSNEFMRPYALYGTGKLNVQYEQVLGSSEMGRPGWKLDAALSKLTTGNLEIEVKDRVYTPGELLRVANSLAADAKVVVQLKVRLVQPSVQIRKGPEKDAKWVVGHGPDDLALHPQDRLDWTRDQFAVLLTAKAKQQLTRLGIRDVSKHVQGKTIRVTGRMTSFNPITDDPVLGRQYEIVVTDVSQLEVDVRP